MSFPFAQNSSIIESAAAENRVHRGDCHNEHRSILRTGHCNEYTPKDTSKVVALKKLDWRAKRTACLFGYSFGIGMTLVLGLGMCLSMQVIGSGGALLTGAGICSGLWGWSGWGSTTPSTRNCCGPARRSMPLRSSSWPGRSARRRSKPMEGAADEPIREQIFNTALRMDEALIALLEEKDLEFITVKEICQRAGVNRSTFYLHYETIADLVNERWSRSTGAFSPISPGGGGSAGADAQPGPGGADSGHAGLPSPLSAVHSGQQKGLPRGVPQPRRHGGQRPVPRAQEAGPRPILDRFEIPAAQHPYYIAYYLEGIAAILKEWLRRDCAEEVELIARDHRVLRAAQGPRRKDAARKITGKKPLWQGEGAPAVPRRFSFFLSAFLSAFLLQQKGVPPKKTALPSGGGDPGHKCRAPRHALPLFPPVPLCAAPGFGLRRISLVRARIFR